MIQTNWGDGSDDADVQTDFNVPNLGGLFLRGVDYKNNVDPDRNKRITIKPGGSTENAVGSFQSDAFQRHHHRLIPDTSTANQYTADGNNHFQYGGYGRAIIKATDIVTDHINGEPRFGLETRSKNSAVNYIIKY